jgi:HK97 family phage portal protein
VANPLTAALSVLRGDHLARRPLSQAAGQPQEVKFRFTPSSEGAPGEYIQSLIQTMNPTDGTYAGKGDGNSAVFACLMALSMGSIEPPLTVFRKDSKGKTSPQPKHPLQAFLDDPNPDLDMLEIRFWLAWARHCDGNAYLLKTRSGNALTGNPIELWPISPTRMRPWTEKGSKNFIDYFQFDDKPGHHEEIPKENVIHFKIGIDDRDPRKGISPLKRLIREIASDAEAMLFADQLLGNFGIPGLVVQLPPDVVMSREQKLEMKTGIEQAFGSNNRGNVGLLTEGATMHQFGFNPQQMNLEVLHNVPEARVCAALGVHPAVAMLGVGLAQTANFASLKAVYEAFTERKLVPLWKLDEAKWNKRLKPDFTSDSNIVVMHDLSEVRALQEDQDALYARLDTAVKTGWVLPDEARSEVGLPPMPDGSGMEPIAKPAPPAPGTVPGQPATDPNKPVDEKPPAKELKTDDLTRWPELTQFLVDAQVDGFEKELNTFQQSQKKRVQRALVNGG